LSFVFLLSCAALSFELLPRGIAAEANPARGSNAPPQQAVRETRVHDPSTIVKCNDEYWLFATGVGIISRRSKDLVNWSDGPRVFTNAPTWTTNTVPGNRGHLWAPDIIRLTNGYFLYYSVSAWGKNTSAIGLVTNATLDPADPNYAWNDAGIVIRTTNEDRYNAIDPNVVLDRDNRLWLAIGSYWTGIKLVELNPQTGLRIATNSPVHSLAWKDSIEAACITRRGDNYFLFVNWGQCCRGTNSTYEIRVGRGAKITGPYLDRDGKDMMQGGGTLFLGSAGKRIGPGHAAILEDAQHLSFHYYNAENIGRPRLEVIPLKWTSDGWPEGGMPLGE
jgi:arabinan endo-1,5-alpha-L-arabinosidase